MRPDVFLVERPWDAWGGDRSLKLRSGASVLAGCGPRVLADLATPVRFDVQRREHLPWVSFPCRRAGRNLVARRLPMDSQLGTERHDISGRLRIGDDDEVQVTIVDAPGRPADLGLNLLSDRLNAHCEWQIHAFEELCEAAELRLPGVVRCRWDDAWRIWHDPGRSDARMALIVKLAQEPDLARSLHSVGRSPRRVLQRVRETMPVSRIQQLDSHCIRDYVRRPGRSAADKAGPRQRLLGVRRRETAWTLENRVASWTLDRIASRSRDYCRQNSLFASSVGSRVSMAARFGRAARSLRGRGELDEADPAGLHHPVPANYPLQMDPRYRRIHRAYLELVREKLVLDEAWGWQHALWADAARQITYSHLTKILVPLYRSPMYVRREPDRGMWSIAPLAPGPFESRSGELYVLDPADSYTDTQAWFDSRLPFAADLGATGCDFAFWWPERQRLVVFWAILSVAEPMGWASMLEGAADSLSRLRAAIRAGSGVRYDVRGMVLAATTGVAEYASDGPEQAAVDGANVVGVRFGVGGPHGVLLRDFDTALAIAAYEDLERLKASDEAR